MFGFRRLSGKEEDGEKDAVTKDVLDGIRPNNGTKPVVTSGHDSRVPVEIGKHQKAGQASGSSSYATTTPSHKRPDKSQQGHGRVQNMPHVQAPYAMTPTETGHKQPQQNIGATPRLVHLSVGKHSTAAGRALSRLVQLRINFLALDFDQTLVDLHTHGNWKASPQQLATHVRPVFRTLLSMIVNTTSSSNPIGVAIVTFSDQVNLIRLVLQTLVGPQQARRIPVRGGAWYQFVSRGSRDSRDGIPVTEDGKQAHMADAVQELSSIRPELGPIYRRTTLLIDDDHKNIDSSQRCGVRAILLDPENPEGVLESMSQLS